MRNWFKGRDFSKISEESLRKILTIGGFLFLLVFVFVCFEVYVPVNSRSHETVTYSVQKGWSDEQIASDLGKLGLIKSNYFFKLYVALSLKHSSLQAGKYNLSPRMSIYEIARKMALGDVIKNNLVIPEGWDVKDIGDYLESKGFCTEPEFIKAAKKDYSNEFEFLKSKPKDVSLEGYLFPDTYEVAEGDSCDNIVIAMLANFDKKLTPEIRGQISKQNKTIFEIITMASLLEKEVRTMEDKKIVSGILWKRIADGMHLQLDATVNYITRKDDPGVAIKDTKIDSPYNTYKYGGLPKGPISNPGLDSITAALNPTKTAYWFYLSNGRTIYSKTGAEHLANKAKYLND